MSAASQEEITQEKIIEVVSTLRQLYNDLRATNFNAQAAQEVEAWIADHPSASDRDLRDYFGRSVTIPPSGWFTTIAKRVKDIKGPKIAEIAQYLVEAAERKLKSDNAAMYSRFNDIKQYYEPALRAFGYQLTGRPVPMKPSGVLQEMYDYNRHFIYYSIYNKPLEYPDTITWDTVVATLATLEELKSRGIYPNVESDASKAYTAELNAERSYGAFTHPKSTYGVRPALQLVNRGGGRIRKSRNRKARKSRSRNRKSQRRR